MDAQQLKQFEQSLIDELFANLTQQAQTTPLQIAAPQAEQPRPYYRGPSPEKIAQRQAEAQRNQINDQLRALVETSTARLYEMLTARLDEMKAVTAPRVSPPCTPSRDNLY